MIKVRNNITIILLKKAMMDLQHKSVARVVRCCSLGEGGVKT